MIAIPGQVDPRRVRFFAMGICGVSLFPPQEYSVARIGGKRMRYNQVIRESLKKKGTVLSRGTEGRPKPHQPSLKGRG